VIPIKRDPEIHGMRVAGRAAARVLEVLRGSVKPGVSTAELDACSLDAMRSIGAVSAFLGYKGFPGHICISVNHEVVHGVGGGRRLQVGDVVKLDVGVRKNGWIGDTACTVAVGAVSSSALRLMQVTEDALRCGIEQARGGSRLGDVGAAIQAVVEASGMSVVREFVGHGVGRELHEEPQVPNFGRAGSGPKLKPGMTLAIEPMVNLGASAIEVLDDKWTVVTADRSLSAHFEHTVLITRGDAEVLTFTD
jgi:methionyl aminopeptidase